jgi:hypothetical protein
MAVVLTNRFTSDETLVAAGKLAALQDEANKRGAAGRPVGNPSAGPLPRFHQPCDA